MCLPPNDTQVDWKGWRMTPDEFFMSLSVSHVVPEMSNSSIINTISCATPHLSSYLRNVLGYRLGEEVGTIEATTRNAFFTLMANFIAHTMRAEDFGVVHVAEPLTARRIRRGNESKRIWIGTREANSIVDDSELSWDDFRHHSYGWNRVKMAAMTDLADLASGHLFALIEACTCNQGDFFLLDRSEMVERLLGSYDLETRFRLVVRRKFIICGTQYLAIFCSGES
jgi:hypothetical protein